MESQILEVISLFGYEKSVRQPVVVEVRSLLRVVAEMLRRTGMERDNAGFMELGLQDMSLGWVLLQFDVIDP